MKFINIKELSTGASLLTKRISCYIYRVTIGIERAEGVRGSSRDRPQGERRRPWLRLEASGSTTRPYLRSGHRRRVRPDSRRLSSSGTRRPGSQGSAITPIEGVAVFGLRKRRESTMTHARPETHPLVVVGGNAFGRLPASIGPARTFT